MDSRLKFCLSITEQHQPSKLHRFRYLKEVKDGRMGSVLHSRTSGGKTPVTVQVTCAQQENIACKLRLVGCTVFEDLTPHPFYLTGEDCVQGMFQKEFSFAASSSTQEVKLEKVGIVCTPKKHRKGKGKAKGATENGHAAAKTAQSDSTQQDGFYSLRLDKYNLFNRKAKGNPFQGKEVNKLRLAFQVFYQQPGSGEWAPADCQPLHTDVVGDAKIFSTLTVEYLIPDSVSRADQDVWLYMKNPLPAGTSVSDFLVLVENEKQGLRFELQPKELKKHLVVFDFSSATMSSISGSFSVTVQEKKSGDSCEAVMLKLDCLSAGQESDPLNKKQRRMSGPSAPASADPLSELLDAFVVEGEMNDDYDEVMSQLTSESAGDFGPQDVLELQELYEENPAYDAVAAAMRRPVRTLMAG